MSLLQASSGLGRFLSEASFWIPKSYPNSAWTAHAPFAFWLMEACKPRVFVELGTHLGFSYLAFNQALKRLETKCRCFAIDTWKGDEHAGFYGEEVFEALSRENAARYGDYSELIRTTFDEAVSLFQDHSIDVLHIDGRHFYEDVKHDLETWRPKLSERGVVLLHDTNVRARDFGVYRLWEELAVRFPHFEFLAGHGLGILCVGSDVPKALIDLCSASQDRRLTEAVRAAYAHLGGLLEGPRTTLEQLTAAHAQQTAAHAQQKEQDHKFRTLEEDYRQLHSTRSQLEQANHSLQQDHQQLEEAHHSLEQDYRQLQSDRNQLEQANYSLQQNYEQLEQTNILLRQEYQELVRVSEDKFQVLANRHLEVKSDLAKDKSRLEVLQQENRQIQSHLEFRKAELQTLQDHLAETSQRERKLQADLQFRQYQVDAITSSHSWRVTTPLRAVVSRLKGASSPEQNLPAPLGSVVEENRSYINLFDGEESNSSPVAASTERILRPRIVFVSGEPHTAGHTYRVSNIAECIVPELFQVIVINRNELPDRLPDVAGADIVWIWRATWENEIASVIAAARAASAKIIFDVDDLMFKPDLAVTELIDGIRSQDLTEGMVRTFYEKVQTVLMHSDHCTTPTIPLAREAMDLTKPTTVIPNGFNRDVLDRSRYINQMLPVERTDGLTRIGYAAGTLTHQKDLEVASNALARLLKGFPHVRLVLFRGTVELTEFPCLQAVSEQIEWRERVALQDLPSEYARFDINIAPLQVGNPYCEAKSELKYFEAALVHVPTVASPTRPFADAIRHGETGLLALSDEEWYTSLDQLIRDPEARERIAKKAYAEVLWLYGPERRNLIVTKLLNQLLATRPAQASLFQIDTQHGKAKPVPTVEAAKYDVIYQSQRIDTSRVTVVIPLFNYGHFFPETFDSLRKQTIRNIDIVVVDDCSTDNSLSVARELLERHAGEFNLIVLLKNHKNSKLGKTRNVGVEFSDTELFLPLDPDNVLLPDCIEKCLELLDNTGAAFVYPTIETFGDQVGIRMGELEYNPALFSCGNYIDAMAMVRKACWIGVGGYSALEPVGWEDYDFWCKLAEQGMFGVRVKDVIARYRVHGGSMLRTITELPQNKPRVFQDLNSRHPWLQLRVPQPFHNSNTQVDVLNGISAPSAQSLDELISILRCPITGESLHRSGDDRLESGSGSSQWPIVQNRPVFTPEGREITIHPESHVSNELPIEAIRIINETPGLVLNLSAGGTAQRYPNVVELEYSIFRYTAVAGDVHRLPFHDSVFEAVICLNAFEHYREPDVAMDEVLRVLKPGARFYLRTAFLQPLHEAPHHYYNCTKFGLRHWLRKFKIQSLHVSDNFNPVYAISWFLSDLQFDFESSLSREAAEILSNAHVFELAAFWRDPDARSGSLWDAFQSLPLDIQEKLSAGWEATAIKP